MSKQCVMTMQSHQKRAEYGDGSISVAIPNGANMTPEELYEAKKIRRDAQTLENIEYKRRIDAGEQVERRWQPGPKLGGARAQRNIVGNLAAVTADLKQQADALRGQMEARAHENMRPAAVPVVEIPQRNPLARMEHEPFELKLDAGTGNTTVLFGVSKQGKSTALMKIYDRYYAEREIVSTLWTDNPQIKLYAGHRNLIVGGKWTRHTESIVREQHRIQMRTKNHYKFLNMLDDNLEIKYSKVIDSMLLTWRNAKMSAIFSLQGSTLLQKKGRSNVNNILLFGMNIDEQIEVVVKCYLRGYLKKLGIVSLPDQLNWYHEQTRDHSFIYVRPSDNIVSFHRFHV